MMHKVRHSSTHITYYYYHYYYYYYY